MKLFSCLAGLVFISNITLAQNDSLNFLAFSEKENFISGELLMENKIKYQLIGKNRVEMELSASNPSKKSFFNAPAAKFIIPTLCIAYGVSARFEEMPTRKFDKYIAERVEINNVKHNPIDNYLEVAPAILAYGLDFIPGIRSKHNFRDRTLIMATSYLFVGGVVKAMKSGTKVDRPRRWEEYDSFPSGHTTVSFTGAHILYKEYKDQSVWIGVGGYMIATATGVFRVLNRAHWVSDVVAGAGVGILAAEVGYMMLPVWHRLFGIRDESLVIVPSISTQSFRIGMAYQF